MSCRALYLVSPVFADSNLTNVKSIHACKVFIPVSYMISGHHGQVETGSEASSPRTPLAPLPLLPDGAALPAWLTNWRLRTALASTERFEVRLDELWLPCYGRM